MKKLIAAVLLCGACIQNSYAQTEKGSQFLGLSFGAFTGSTTATGTNYFDNNQFTEKSNYHRYSVSPSYSYFIADNLDITASLGYNFSNSKDVRDSISSSSKSRGYNAGLQVRKYFLFNNKIGIRTGPLVEYSRNRTTPFIEYQTEPDRTQTETNLLAGARLDFVYFPSKKVGLAAGIANLYYNYQKRTSKSSNYSSVSNTFQANLTNGLNLSFYYIL